MKKQNIPNIIEIADAGDAWLIKRKDDDGDYTTTIKKGDCVDDDNEERALAIKELLQGILSEIQTTRYKYAKNWVEIKRMQRKDADKDFVEIEEE